MPIEKRKDETRDEFISRCIKVEIDSDKSQDQAVAICINYADQYFAEVGERGAIRESKKAPKSDTPNKNPKGEGTAKGDASSTRGAEVTERVENILKDKVKDFNERYGEKLDYSANIGQLKAVYQRGVGAFNVSHSPRVKSAEQWALARVNAFLYILKTGRPENPKYTNDFDLLPKKHPKNPDYKKDDMAKSATQSVSDATWSSTPAISINLESYDDYPEAARRNAQIALDWAEKWGWGDCGTPVGKQRANQLANGEKISEDTIARMAAFERHRENSNKELGDGCGRLMWQAWGGDEGVAWAQKKLEQIRGQKTNLAKVKKILIDENLPDETILDMKSRGFKVYIKSARKIRKSDRKAYNRLKTLGLNFDSDYLSGDEKQLDRQKDFSLYMSSDDPILDTLLMKSEKYHYRQVLHTEPVFSIEDAENKEKAFLENHKLKFATIRILYEYKVRPDVPEAISGSRPFCDKLFRKGGEYTLEQIKNLPSGHLKDMGLEPDVFLYRGGFYTLPGTNQTTPYCRHEWRMKAVLI